MANNVLEERITLPNGGEILEAKKDLKCSVPLCHQIIQTGDRYISIASNGNYHLHSPDCAGKSCYDIQVEE